MNPLNWQFLNEPLGRWFIFLAIIGLFLGLWHRVLLEMK